MAAAPCGCGTRHRSPAVAARCPHATDTTPATTTPTTAPAAATLTVRGDDLAGCLTLLDGRLVATTTGVLAVSGYGHGPAPLPGQVADADAVLTLMLEAGATRRRHWRFTPTEHDTAAALLTAQLAAEAAA